MSNNIDTLAAELAYLEAHCAAMPIAELQDRRGAALRAATEISNKIAEADEFDSASFDRAYELALAFDRVGY